MRAIDADAMIAEIEDYIDEYSEVDHNGLHNGKWCAMCEAKMLLKNAPTITPERPKAVWQYHNDEHGVWWGCGNCGKILRRPPHDKRFCSRCGAEMEREA